MPESLGDLAEQSPGRGGGVPEHAHGPDDGGQAPDNDAAAGPGGSPDDDTPGLRPASHRCSGGASGMSSRVTPSWSC
ncbi:MAG TPA: hypothetical protein VHU92_09385 [Streptosporangiaceae bacterium]|nr:hypothetical protein [Streptosporangiaceae bacterium]